MEIITSLQNRTVKNLVRLKNKKDRDLTGTFLVEGRHMIEEAAKAGLLKEIYADEKLMDESWPLSPVFCSESVMDKISQQKSGSSCLGLCRKPEDQPSGLQRLLLLDRVQDPGNVGTLIRSAYAFGADGVILSAGCADPYAPKTLQSSQGAIFHLPVIFSDLYVMMDQLKERSVPTYAAALHHDSICLKNLPVSETYGILIGNEGQGLSEELIEAADRTVFIEMSAFESLNAAIAGSILLYHFQKDNG